jgi:hypothetical protein
MFRKLTLMFLVALSLVACRDESRLGYMELTGRVFIFNPRIGEATYVVTLGVVKEPPPGSHVEAVFDNPAGGSAITVTQIIRPGQTKISLESEPLHCIVKDKPYAFKVSLLSEKGELLQVVDSSIHSTLDQSVMPDAALVEGPAYDPNPELKGNVAGRLPDGPKFKCPV